MMRLLIQACSLDGGRESRRRPTVIQQPVRRGESIKGSWSWNHEQRTANSKQCLLVGQS